MVNTYIQLKRKEIVLLSLQRSFSIPFTIPISHTFGFISSHLSKDYITNIFKQLTIRT